MRFTIYSAASLLLVGSASLVEAGHQEHTHHRVVRAPRVNNADPIHSSLAARSIDSSVHLNDKRTLCLLNGILGGKFDKYCNKDRPSCYWKDSGSGLDGWDYDCDGNKCPGHLPGGWKWFGKDKGWGPPRGWYCAPTLDLPWDFLNKCKLFGWWSVSIEWQKCPTNWSPPSWWPPVKPPPKPTTTTTTTTTTTSKTPEPTPPSCNKPPQGWSGCGDGNDGYDFDFDCKPCPYTGDKLFDSNGKWKFFGVKYGWQPEESWNIPYPDWKPPSGWGDAECAKATWWSPGSEWKYPSSWTLCIPRWKELNPNWCSYLDTKCGKDDGNNGGNDGGNNGPSRPPAGWQCNGSGNDGWDVDYDGKPCPYQGDRLFDSNGKWKFFGSNYGWQPEEAWNIPYPNWQPPSGWGGSECLKATWWSPGSEWQYPSSFSVCISRWKQLNPNWCSYLDSKCGKNDDDDHHDDDHDDDWECDGSGDDGKDYDHEGKPCPWGNGWKWFGIKWGWLPPRGWTCAPNWTPIDCDYSKASWWVPPSFNCPDWFKPKIPSFWFKFGFHPLNWPKQDWQCNGSGDDGWDHDHEGNTKPDWCLDNWKWFGTNKGWHPIKSWTCQSNWSPPKQWQPKLCTWWKPQVTLSLPQGYWCPPWWPKNLLLGNLLNWF
ncbi:hypothetical protein OIO90_002153 [Microbotryomycetes sp. JL221]|nr:hypothetical protein OIO90_002153 [Microbotryomycetes sp. JL221]